MKIDKRHQKNSTTGWVRILIEETVAWKKTQSFFLSVEAFDCDPHGGNQTVITAKHHSDNRE